MGAGGLVVMATFPSLFVGCEAAQSSPSGTPARPPRSANGPVRTAGARLVDARGQEVRLTGVNWFGLETEAFAPHGLWTRNLEDMLDQIVATGFNSLRLPFSNQLLEGGSLPASIDFAKNPDLKGLNGLQVMDRVIDGAARRQLAIVLDRHRPTARAQSELWYTDEIPEARWIDDWKMLADRYRSQPAVIGADLHNEPHGAATWGNGDSRTDWRLAAERAGNAILDVNPNWLVIVAGIESVGDDHYWWGGNLAAVHRSPVRLQRADRLVYSAHDYGPPVYPQPWFASPDFPSNLEAVWAQHWAWIAADGVAPVLVGEFGGRSVGGDAEGMWQRHLIRFLKASGLSYTYWSWNPDSGDTGGILNDDWTTVNDAKLAMLRSYQWPKLRFEGMA